MRKSISHQLVFTQDYDDANLRFTESYSPAVIQTGTTGLIRISNILIQSFYTRSTVAIDTPVSLAIIPNDANFLDRLQVIDPDVNVLVDYREGDDYIQAWNPGVNDQLMSVNAMDINPYRPHRFIYDSVPVAKYDHVSAVDLLVTNQKLSETIMAHGQTFVYPGKIEIQADDAEFLYLIPYIAGLKKTEIASSFRINARLEG